MQSRDAARAYAAAVLCIVLPLVFFLTGVLPMRVPLYFPLSHRWGLSSGTSAELSMDYYGRSLLALAWATVAFVLTYGLCLSPCIRPRLRAPLLRLLTIYAASALLLGASLYGYKLYNRQPIPEPLPSWYQPR